MKRIILSFVTALVAVTAAFAFPSSWQPVLWQSAAQHDGISLNFGTQTYYTKVAGQPARYGAFTDFFTATRNSVATFQGSDGLVKYANENIVLQSQTIENAAWVPDNASVTANSVTAPDGTATADALNETVANTGHGVSQAAIATVGITDTFSVYVQPAARTWVRLTMGASASVFYNLSTCTIGTIAGSASVRTSAASAGGTWCRLSVSGVPVTNGDVSIYAASADNVVTYAGAAQVAINVWGAQAQRGSAAQASLPTVASAKFDQPRIEYTSAATGVNYLPQSNNLTSAWTFSGAVGSFTNLYLQNQTVDTTWTQIAITVSANQIAAPDGTVTADKLIESTGAATDHILVQNITFTAGTAYTASFFVKNGGRDYTNIQFGAGAFTSSPTASFNISACTTGSTSGSPTKSTAIAFPNGWCRVSMTATATSSASAATRFYIGNSDISATYAGDGASGIYVWGLQMQTGAEPSYQALTVAGTVTVSDNTFVSPSNTLTASMLTESSGGTTHLARQDTTILANTVSTYSTYLKANGRGFAQVKFTDTAETNGCSVDVNLSTGATGAATALGTGTSQAVAVKDGGNGYWKFSLSCMISATAVTGRAQVLLASALGTTSYSGDGVSGALMWGNQVEGGAVATVYTDTQPKNFVLRSQEIDNAGAWAKGQSTITVNSTRAPDGTSSADSLIETAVTNFHTATQSSIQLIAGRTYTFSAYAKASTRSVLQLSLGTTSYSTTPYQLFNLTTCAAGTANQNTLSVSATNVGDGWCRISITQVANVTSAANTMTFALATDANNGGSNNYAGDGTSGAIIWGAQVNEGNSPTAYVATVATTLLVPQYTNSTGTVIGLLSEAARTNLALQSETFGTTWTAAQSTVTSDTTTAPDGSATADKIVEDGTANVHSLTQAITVTAATINNFSVFIKPAERWSGAFEFRDTATGLIGCRMHFNLLTLVTSSTVLTTGTCTSGSVTPYVNGWYRVSMAGNLGGAITGAQVVIFTENPYLTNSYTGDSASGFYVWGGQLEQAQFAGSYVPTTTASVARSADSLTRTLGAEFSATAGTVVVAGRASGGQDAAAGSIVWNFSNLTDNERLRLVRPAATDLARSLVTTGAVNQASFDNTFTNLTAFKHAMAWAVNDFAAAFNGGAVQTDTLGALPTTITSLGLGEFGGGSQQGNCWIRTFDSYTVRRDNGFLQSASTP